MPYIKKTEREKLDVLVDSLITRIKTCRDPAVGDDLTDFAGRFNYVITRLAIGFLLPYKAYWAYALIRGVFQDAADEMYRRMVAPYEDSKIKENGDVYSPFDTETGPR